MRTFRTEYLTHMFVGVFCPINKLQKGASIYYVKNICRFCIKTRYLQSSSYIPTPQYVEKHKHILNSYPLAYLRSLWMPSNCRGERLFQETVTSLGIFHHCYFTVDTKYESHKWINFVNCHMAICPICLWILFC